MKTIVKHFSIMTLVAFMLAVTIAGGSLLHAGASVNKTKTYTIRTNDISKFVIKNNKLKIKYGVDITAVDMYGGGKAGKIKKLSLKVNEQTKYRIIESIEDPTDKGRQSSYTEVKNMVDNNFRNAPYSTATEGFYYIIIKVKKGVVKSIKIQMFL